MRDGARNRTCNGGELARLSGVTVRALHYYDAVGLPKPASVGENGYGRYGREELLRLQQILFHRELGLSAAVGAGLHGTGRTLRQPSRFRGAILRGSSRGSPRGWARR
jgi:hypothetical protein